MKKMIYFVFAVCAFLTACAPKQQQKFGTAETEQGSQQSVSDPEGDNRGYIVNVGDMAPDFELRLDNGEIFRLSEQRGKVVMIQFTASWCGICRREMPFIEHDIWQKYGADPEFVLIGADREEPEDKVALLKEKTGISYPIAYDTDGSVFRLYAEPNAGITRNVLVDRDGKIILLTRKFDETEFAGLCDKIAELLK